MISFFDKIFDRQLGPEDSVSLLNDLFLDSFCFTELPAKTSARPLTACEAGKVQKLEDVIELKKIFDDLMKKTGTDRLFDKDKFLELETLYYRTKAKNHNLLRSVQRECGYLYKSVSSIGSLTGIEIFSRTANYIREKFEKSIEKQKMAYTDAFRKILYTETEERVKMRFLSSRSAMGPSDANEKLRLMHLLVSLNPKMAKNFFQNQKNPLHIPCEMSSLSFESMKRAVSQMGIDVDNSQNIPMLESIYAGLALGRFVGNERENLPITQSPFARLSKGRELYNMAIANYLTISPKPINTKDNLKLSKETVNRLKGAMIIPGRNGGTYCNRDKTLEFGIREGKDLFSFEEAISLGLVTPEKAAEIKSKGYTSPIRVRIVGISFRETRLSSLQAGIRDGKADAANIIGFVPDNIKDADKAMEIIIPEIEKTIAHPEGGVTISVPVFTGQSMGGMLANAMAAKYNYPSIAFNALGIGSGVRDFIGNHNWDRANDAAHAECHQTYNVVREGGKQDFASIPGLPFPGQTYEMENKSGQSSLMGAHKTYTANIRLNLNVRKENRS